MKLRNDTSYRPGRLGRLLSRRDWAYVLGLLVPFIAYDLALKIVRIASLSDEHGLLGSLQLVQSDLLFNLGYALLWVGLFAVVKAGLWRALVVGLFHVVTILLALIATAAHRFYEVTGSTLDVDVVLFFLSSLGEVWAIAASEVTPLLVVAASAALLYAVLGPWLLARLVARRGASTGRGVARLGISLRGYTALLTTAVALFSLSLLPGGVAAHESESTAHASESFSREAFVNAAVTGVEEMTEDQGPPVNARAAREQLPLDNSLVRTVRTEERNVVVVHLESVRARSVTPYNEDLDITPFLAGLSEESLVADRAYAVVPHTTNALVATLCGVSPPIGRWQTYLAGDWIPARCLPNLLGERGYNSVYFTSSEQTFERRPEVVENMGYEEFYPVETMKTEGFEKANYFGYEDNVMLEPSREWLEENANDGPFIATYETITPHHDYLAPDDSYGRKELSEEHALNRYLNSVRYVDFFVKNLMEQYKELGLYDDTIFIVYGDHGEAFGEHDLKQHDNVPYEEGLWIPLLVHAPQRFQSGERVGAPVNQLDVLPTVLDLLGYRVEGGEYPGSSLLGSLPKNRTLMASCWYDEECLASLDGNEKYIYNYGDRPEEVYDLSEDPLERNNLADERDPDELRHRRHDLLEWRARVEVIYSPPPSRLR